jgi:hypothetical protein
MRIEPSVQPQRTARCYQAATCLNVRTDEYFIYEKQTYRYDAAAVDSVRLFKSSALKRRAAKYRH